ncbi:hypothetical protein MHYP_G00338120 [Metynnis hypsauchen]
MATRRLTDAFLLMRNNAIQNRQILAEQVSTNEPRRTLNTRSSAAEYDELADDRMALVSGISLDPEAAIGVTKRLPPKWVEGVDEIQYEITRIRQKMKELAGLHDKHMNRPTLDDSSEEEHAIEITTQEITQMFHRCQRAVTGLQSRCGHCTEQEERLLRNVVSSLAQSLQELSTSFRHTQSSYLKRMKNREERSRHFFDSGPLMEEDEDVALYDRGFTDDQLALVEQNTVLVEEREREIRQIVQSISDLNEIFRDLAGMVVEQGTVLDRIDFNVEQACVRTEDGLKQLQKAEQYQKKNRKMLIILILTEVELSATKASREIRVFSRDVSAVGEQDPELLAEQRNMANVVLEFKADAGDSEPPNRPVLVVGQLSNLQQTNWTQIKAKLQPAVSKEMWQSALCALNPNPTDSCPLYLSYATVAALPSRVSRHNCPASAHFLTRLVRTCLPPGSNRCILMVCERSDVFASACAIARAFPLFTRRSTSSRRTEKKHVTVEFVTVGQDNGPLELSTLECLSNTADGVRLAARIVDTPCSEMNTDHFLEEIKAVGNELGITPTIIRGEELKHRGFGGIYGVGKAAEHPPALAVLSHTPSSATQTIAWVGKGIVYDTGGLSIKGKTTMPGMKRDCGGAAAILGAFKATVKLGFKDNLHAVFCLAENAVGPTATRPDDIHTLYSGKTVEINNTDAEGRLVLSDGVVYASKDLSADIILDMATLTGAQGISTGKYHAAVMTNSEEWEAACVKAGRSSGDLAHPLVYCPELHFSEFTSAVADMKNSVADRENAQSSCAGLFIGSHLGFDWPGVWVHVDIASPVHAGERATGFGVALLLALFGQASEDPVLNMVSPLGVAAANASSVDQMERDSKRRRLV